jgi:hypothetical protein
MVPNENLTHFLHIRRTYLRSGGSSSIAKPREAYHERLALHFPKISRKNLELVDQIIERQFYRQ